MAWKKINKQLDYAYFKTLKPFDFYFKICVDKLFYH